ncbi:ABC transporter permease subunit [Planctomycetota bacterium]|nr:ABC transporter permease subunit [Planctomycetota bacterium]
MSNSTKPSSPLKDSLRLFVRNKPSVIAGVMILILTVAAVSGQFYSGKIPTDVQRSLIENAEAAGDVHGIEVNPDAVLDSSKPELKDTFIAPGGESRVHENKTYWLGTDHLGRDVMARLWEGSSISLTIGFLSVGISLLLGISLGGIAGYFGRSSVRLPFLAMFLTMLGAGITWAADFNFIAIPLAAIGLGFFVVQAAMAVMGKRYYAVGAFAVTALLTLGVYFFVDNVETSTPEGRSYTQAALVKGKAQEVVRRIKTFGTEVKKAEDSVPDAPSEEWMEAEQYGIEKDLSEISKEVARYQLIDHEAQIEMVERTTEERKERIEHLESLGLTGMVKEEQTGLTNDAKALTTLKAGLKAKKDALTAAEKKHKETESKEAAKFVRQSSNDLLERRANFRTTLGNFNSLRDTKFEALVDAKLLDGRDRYPMFRMLRGLALTVILILILVVSMLFVVGAAQASASESQSPLKKLFLPTISVDDMVMRFTEILMGIPVIYLILMVLALFERDVYVVMAIIGLTSWMGTTRFVRAEILALREQDFVQAARALGIPEYRIIWRHLVPNAISPVLVSATLGVATAVLAESTLSFLGIGAGPDQNTWGKVLAEGRQYMFDAGWLIWIPGVAILITVLSFNMLGEGLREAFNPKLRGR